MKENLLETFEVQNSGVLSKASFWLFLILVSVAVLTDCMLIVSRSEYLVRAGNIFFDSKIKLTGFIIAFHLFVVPAASLALSLLLSLVPFRDKKVSEKYLSMP